LLEAIGGFEVALSDAKSLGSLISRQPEQLDPNDWTAPLLRDPEDEDSEERDALSFVSSQYFAALKELEEMYAEDPIKLSTIHGKLAYVHSFIHSLARSLAGSACCLLLVSFGTFACWFAAT
jgi:hypothetical protein